MTLRTPAAPDKTAAPLRRAAVTLALASLATTATACKDPPSFRVRWAIAGETLTRASQCADVGVFDVQIITRDELGVIAEVNSYPCFPEGWEDPDDDVAASHFDDGDYAIELRAISRNRSEWIDEAELAQQELDAERDGNDYLLEPRYELCRPPLPVDAAGTPLPGGGLAQPKDSDVFACRPEDLSCDCATVTIKEDTMPVVDGFDLAAPPQCLDGLDNDRDGQVDELDPACSVSNIVDAVEAGDVATSQFDLRVSFFGGNSNVSCPSIALATGAARIVVTLDGEVLRFTDDEGNLESSLPCTLDPIRFTRVLETGMHDISLVAASSAGEALTEAATQSFEIDSSVGGAVQLFADFAPGDFFAPIEELAVFTVSFLPYEGAPLRGCAPALAEEGTLSLPEVRIRVVNSHGGPLPTPVRDEAGVALNGDARACPNNLVLTEPVTWGQYAIEVEALSAEGEVCFSNVGAPTPAAPSDPFGVSASRVTPIPQSCRDCEEHADCGGSRCVDGICLLACDENQPCDVPLSCVEGACTPPAPPEE